MMNKLKSMTASTLLEETIKQFRTLYFFSLLAYYYKRSERFIPIYNFSLQNNLGEYFFIENLKSFKKSF